MHTSMTRATIIWLVGAAVVGAVAGGLHVLRSDIGGAHTGAPLAVGAWALTVIAAALLYHGIVVAAGEQDAAAGPAEEPTDDTAYEDGSDVYTFRRGKPVDDPAHRTISRD